MMMMMTMMMTKALQNFCTFSILAPQGTSCAKDYQSWPRCIQQGPSVNFPNFVDFVDGVTDKNTRHTF